MAVIVIVRMQKNLHALDAARVHKRNYAPMTIHGALTHAEAERLAARIAELEHERKHLLAVIEILKEASSSLHFIDILQSIARKLGEETGMKLSSTTTGRHRRNGCACREVRPEVAV